MEMPEIELYIQIKDGQPFEHPIIGENFRQVFPDIDVNNLPLDRFAKFIRVKIPRPADTFEVAESQYHWDGNVVKDNWVYRPMTDEERVVKHDQMVDELGATRDYMLSFAQDMLLKVSDPDSAQVWRDHINDLMTWVLEGIDPITPELPKPPVLGVGGKWRKRNR